MTYNLIEESWVPVRRENGPQEYIPPWQVSRASPKPYSGLAAARPDLTGAIVQMLVGLLQTTCAPADEAQWREWFLHPPEPETLHGMMAGVKDAFELQGKHPFMQDMDCPIGGDGFPLAQLLPDQPAGNTLKLNKDHFVKASVMDGMCPACLAPALYWRQTSMGSFGGGFRDSLRLKSPMTVLVMGPDLWRTLWLNVLPKDRFQALNMPGPAGMADRFPWMGTVRRSDKNQSVRPGEVHQDQVYWQLPQSVLVDFDHSTPDALCPVCGREGQTLYHFFHRRKYGPLYEKSGWRHPLSPYFYDDEGKPVFVQIPSGGVCFGDWLGVAAKGKRFKTERRPPEVVEAFYDRQKWLFDRGWELDYRAWVFGVEMDQAKSLVLCGWSNALVGLAR